ncbi:MAG: PA14 domain-containing protein, partial [Verrucomicrobiales bacterium]
INNWSTGAGINLPDQSGIVVRTPVKSSNEIVYSNLDFPAATYRLVTRTYNSYVSFIDGQGGSNTSLDIDLYFNGSANSTATVNFPWELPFWTPANYPSQGFKVGEKITSLRIVGKSSYFRWFDQFELQASVPDPTSAAEAQMEWRQLGSGGGSNFDLPSFFPESYTGIGFKALLQIDQAGSYEFKITSLGGSTLRVGGDLVVDNDGIHQAEEFATGSVNLAAGFHEVDVDMFETTAASGLTVEWKPPGASNFEPIPDGLLDSPLGIDSLLVGNGRLQEAGFGGGAKQSEAVVQGALGGRDR